MIGRASISLAGLLAITAAHSQAPDGFRGQIPIWMEMIRRVAG